jgi:N-acetylmuramoyl-L-alanine amidase
MHLSIDHNLDLKIGRLPESPQVVTKRKVRGRYTVSAILLSLLVLIVCPVAGSGQPVLEANAPVVVIDPGHGGNDLGAEGPEGTLEKAVTLNLARLIAERLTTRYQVALTRSDDYGMALPERTAVANRSAADIFISLHTGSGFISSIVGSAVYFYQTSAESSLTAEIKIPKSLTESSPPLSWDQIQLKYLISSEKLAKSIQQAIAGTRRSPDTKIQGAPLLVLEGADMPAVAIEIGNMSNPNEEKMLRDPEFLARMAGAIVQGIDRFFAPKPKN